MMERIAADLVLLAHFGFILFATLGGVLVLRWRRLAWLHIPAVAWAAAVEIAGWTCPLTPIESRLRIFSGEPGYQAGFLDHWLVPIIYPTVLTREIQIALGGSVLALNLVVYAWIARRRSRAVRRRPPLARRGDDGLRNPRYTDRGESLG